MMMLKDLAKEAGRAMMKAAESDVGGVEAHVEALLERISEGMLSQDRREGMEQLKALLQQPDPVAALEAVASMAVPVMCSVLQEDADDPDLVQGALECLLLASGGALEDIDEDPEAEQRRAGAAGAAGALTAHALASDRNALQLLLSQLEVEEGSANDFYARFWTIQLLTRLVHASPFAVQDAIMSRSQGVVKVMDLLREQEVIRNEALLLLIALSRTDEEIQKIIAFEGAFDMLFEILTEEGYVHGGVIVQDSLVLLNNLLRGNPSNQLMFREAGYIANLHRLLFVDLEAPPAAGGLVGAARALEDGLQGGAPAAALPPQVTANLLCALEMVLILTAPAAAAAAGADAGARGRHEMALMCAEANHALLAKTGTLDEVLALSLRHDDEAPRAVRVMALQCAQRLVAGRRVAQDRLGSSVVAVRGHPVPVLQALLHRLLTTDDAAEAAALDQLFAAFCCSNPDGQMAIVSTMLPISGAGTLSDTASCGELLAAAILGAAKDAQASARAGVVMCHLLRGNAAAKEKALRVPLTMPAAGRAPALLIPSAVARLAEASAAASVHVAARLLRMLVVWTHECPPAVDSLLSEPGHLPLLVDLAQGRVGGGDVAVCGLGATLLGCCLLYNEGGRAAPGLGKVAVLDVITSRVGLSDYFRRLEALRESELMQAAADASGAPAAMTRAAVSRLAAAGHDRDGQPDQPSLLQDNPFDAEFAAFMTEFVAVLKREALALYSQPHAGVPHAQSEPSPASVNGDDAQSVISQLQQQVEELQLRNAALAQDLMAQKAKPGEENSVGDPEAVAKAELRCMRLQVENEAMKREVAQARDQATNREHEARAAQAQLAESTSLLQKLESELAALSEAYGALEQDAFNKEAELRQLQARMSEHATSSGIKEASDANKDDAGDEQDGLQGELDDLLVCLGQEEQKVAILSAKLVELGIDADALIEPVGFEEDDDSLEGEAGVDVHQWVADHPVPVSPA